MLIGGSHGVLVLQVNVAIATLDTSLAKRLLYYTIMMTVKVATFGCHMQPAWDNWDSKYLINLFI